MPTPTREKGSPVADGVWPEQRLADFVRRTGGSVVVSAGQLFDEFGIRHDSRLGRRNVEAWLLDSGLGTEPALGEVERDARITLQIAPDPEDTKPVRTTGQAPERWWMDLLDQLGASSESKRPTSASQSDAAPAAFKRIAHRVEATDRPGRRGRWQMRAAAALAVVGVLLVAEATVTVLWREPFTALSVAGEQAELSRELAAIERSDQVWSPAYVKRADRKPRPSAARLTFGKLAASFRAQLSNGEALGRVRIPALGVDQVVVEGTAGEDLKRAPGHYSDTAMPGERRTVGIAGHRTTYTAPFRHLDDLERGDEVRVVMPYGRFLYRIDRTEVVEPSKAEILRNYGYGRLVLTACHPLFSDSERIVAIGSFVRATPRQRSVVASKPL